MSSEQGLSQGQKTGPDQTSDPQQQHIPSQHQGVQHQQQQPAVTPLPANTNESYVCQWVGCGKRADTPETLYVCDLSVESTIQSIQLDFGKAI